MTAIVTLPPPAGVAGVADLADRTPAEITSDPPAAPEAHTWSARRARQLTQIVPGGAGLPPRLFFAAWVVALAGSRYGCSVKWAMRRTPPPRARSQKSNASNARVQPAVSNPPMHGQRPKFLHALSNVRLWRECCCCRCLLRRVHEIRPVAAATGTLWHRKGF